MDAIRCLARTAACAVILLSAVGLAAAGEFVEVAVPLGDGGHYSPRDFAAQCNEQLGTHIPLGLISDKPRKLTDRERRALIAADAAGILPVRFAAGQVIFTFRNPQDDATRRHHRQLIEKYLGLSMDWPAERGLHLPGDFLPAERTLLLIHGLESHADEFDRFQQACRAWGVQTIVFDYPNDGPIAWSGDRLSEDLKGLGARHPQLRVTIVAHSMGGLVARHALETPDKRPSCVSDLFTLGTPHAGSKYSDFQPVVELCREAFSKYALYGGTIRDGLGEAADDLHEGSEFLTTLNGRERPPGVTYHVAAGSKSFLPQSVLIATERAAGSMTTGSPRERLLTMLKSPEFQNGFGDGAVAVGGALLPGVEDRRVFELNHLQLVKLPGERPEECEVFQWIMASLAWRRLAL